MSLLRIYTGTDNPTLRKISAPVERITKETLKLLRNMDETMEKEEGVGLAAPQVGVHQRIILVAKMSPNDKEIIGTIPMINPQILEYSLDTALMDEGCLSIPGKYAKVRRHTGVKVRFLDTKGKDTTLHLQGLSAQVVQHEIEHLDGILFTDHIAGPLQDVQTRKKEDGYLV